VWVFALQGEKPTHKKDEVPLLLQANVL